MAKTACGRCFSGSLIIPYLSVGKAVMWHWLRDNWQVEKEAGGWGGESRMAWGKRGRVVTVLHLWQETTRHRGFATKVIIKHISFYLGWHVWLLCAYCVPGSLCLQHNVEETLSSGCTYCGREFNLIKSLGVIAFHLYTIAVMVSWRIPLSSGALLRLRCF